MAVNVLTYNFSNEQCTLPEDDLSIETCRSILSVKILDYYNITVHSLVCNKLSEHNADSIKFDDI